MGIHFSSTYIIVGVLSLLFVERNLEALANSSMYIQCTQNQYKVNVLHFYLLQGLCVLSYFFFPCVHVHAQYPKFNPDERAGEEEKSWLRSTVLKETSGEEESRRFN